MDIEAKGTRTVLIVTTAFESSARQHGRRFGNPSFEPILVPHPIPQGEELQLLAKRVSREVAVQAVKQAPLAR